MRKPKVVFFGSGPVAAKSLELLAKNFDIEAVVTKPKPAHHRGNFPVLDVAEKLKLPVKTVTNKASLDVLIDENPFKSQVGILIDFGIIVSQKVIDYFPKGIVNSHFSLLPELRGADPITFSILSGQKQTGVSLMLLVEKMDEGPLVFHGVYDIPENTTAPQLTQNLIKLSDTFLKYELPRYLKDPTDVMPQSVTGREVSYSRKLNKEDGRIELSKPAEQLEREVRAYTQWPKSYTTIAGKDVIITKAHVKEGSEPSGQGSVFQTEEKELALQTGEGLLIIDKLKPAGKNEMTAKEFIIGYGNKIV